MSYVIYAQGHRRPDVHPRCYVPVFPQVHHAKEWIERFIGGKPYERTGGTIKVQSDFEIELRSDQLDAILAASPGNSPLPDEHDRWIKRFKYGTWDEVIVADDPVDQPEPEVKRERRAQRPPGYVTITELCAASGVPALTARAALRASGRVKPDYGWAFAPGEIAEVRKLCGMR